MLLDYLFFRFTVSTDSVITPGNQLQNLNYQFSSDAKFMQKQKALLMVLTVFLPYGAAKLNDIISSGNWTDPRVLRNGTFTQKLKYVLAKLVQCVSNMFKVASLVNLIMFFLTHSKRSLAERLLGISLKRIDPNQRRYVDFTYINRIIVWNALGQAMSGLLPFLDVSKIKGMFQMSSKLTQFITLDEKEIGSDSWCGICGTTQICMPYRSKQCQHLYCYYCIQSKLQEVNDGDEGSSSSEKWKCIKCRMPVESIEPYTLINK